MFDVVVVGHITRDENTFGGSKHAPRPGGTAYYASMAYQALGLSTAVVTKMRREDSTGLLEDLLRFGVHVECHDASRTCHFQNLYSSNPDEREQRVPSPGEPFEKGELAATWARVFHFGPLLPGDIPEAALRSAKGKGALIVLDAQGLVRSLDGDRVRLEPWRGDPDYLKWVDILKGDVEEIQLLAGESSLEAALAVVAGWGPAEILATAGRHGCWTLRRGESLHIPAFKPSKEVDATGCGDTFTAGYVASRLCSEDIRVCTRYAAALAAVKMEGLGAILPSDRKLGERVRTLLVQAPGLRA